MLVPQQWSWEQNAHTFYSDHALIFATAAAAYFPVVFILRHWMRDRKPFALGGVGSSLAGNTIMWWEVFLAGFSLIGAWHCVPLVLEPLFAGSSFSEALCGTKMNDDPRAFWGFLFSLSKVVEFADTLFVVLRKKNLILLQYWHHFATMVYCWYGTVVVYRYNHSNLYFAAMNLCVHTVMYSWYAVSRTGWRSPKWLQMAITLMQLSQMAAGIGIIVVAVMPDAESGCGKWWAEDAGGVTAAFGMYGSYLFLFGQLYYTKYVHPKPRRPAAKPKPGSSLNEIAGRAKAGKCGARRSPSARLQDKKAQ
jgi:hypothetical protein